MWRGLARPELAGCLMAVCFLAGGPPAHGAAKKGPLAKHAAHVGKLLKLRVDAGKLALDRAHWEPPPADKAQPGAGVRVRVGVNLVAGRSGAEKAFNELRTACGAGGYSRSGWNNRVTVSFTGGGVAAQLKVQGEHVQVTLRETDEPGNDLDVTDDGVGSLRIVFSNSGGDLLVLVQSGAGRISVAQIAGDKTFAAKGESFAAFYRQRAEYVERDLFPLLGRLGVGLPPGRFSPEVVGAVCGRVRPYTAEETAEYAALLKRMDDDDFQEREAGTQALSKRFARFGPLVEQTVKQPPSQEVATRLEKVLAAHTRRREIEEFVRGMKLLADPAYLIHLLGHTKGTDRAAVAARLEELTGRKLGDDPAAWRKWQSGGAR